MREFSQCNDTRDVIALFTFSLIFNLIWVHPRKVAKEQSFLGPTKILYPQNNNKEENSVYSIHTCKT